MKKLQKQGPDWFLGRKMVYLETDLRTNKGVTHDYNERYRVRGTSSTQKTC